MVCNLVGDVLRSKKAKFLGSRVVRSPKPQSVFLILFWATVYLLLLFPKFDFFSNFHYSVVVVGISDHDIPRNYFKFSYNYTVWSFYFEIFVYYHII